MINKHKNIYKNSIQYDINTAIAELKNITYNKKKRRFDESVDIVIQLLKNVIKSDNIIRGVAKLTYKLPKTKKIVVLSDNINDLKLANQAGVYLSGGKDLVEKINNSRIIDFDVLITTPEFMPHITIIGSILGPKKLMPSIYLGTITNNISVKIDSIKNGEIFFNSDKYGNIHSSIGKLSFPHDYICQNIKDLVDAVKRHKTLTSNTNVISRVYLSTTMGKSIKILIESIDKQYQPYNIGDN